MATIFKPNLEAHRFSRVRDSAMRRAFVCRAKRRWPDFPLNALKSLLFPELEGFKDHRRLNLIATEPALRTGRSGGNRVQAISLCALFVYGILQVCKTRRPRSRSPQFLRQDDLKHHIHLIAGTI